MPSGLCLLSYPVSCRPLSVVAIVYSCNPTRGWVKSLEGRAERLEYITV